MFYICREKAGKVIGFGKLCKNEIGMMYITPKQQKKGIGKSIMKKLERLAKTKGFKKIHIEALRPAIGFYKKLGHSKIESNKNHKDYQKMEKRIV